MTKPRSGGEQHDESCLQAFLRRWGVQQSFIALFVALFFFFFFIHQASIDRLQRPPGTGELVAFSVATNGGGWTSGLLSTISAQAAYPCGWAAVYTAWYGVHCDARGQTYLVLAFDNNNLQGSITRDCLIRLIGLQYLLLGGNPYLSGDVPQISSGRLLDIHETGLSGRIPYMAHLESLDISGTGPNITAEFAKEPAHLLLTLPSLAVLNMSFTQGPIPELPPAMEDISAAHLVPIGDLTAPDWQGLSALRAVNLSGNTDGALLPTRFASWFHHSLPQQSSSTGVEVLDVSWTNFYGGLDLRRYSSPAMQTRLHRMLLDGSNVFPLVMTRHFSTDVDTPSKVRYTVNALGNTSYLDLARQYFHSPTHFHGGPRFGKLRFNQTALTFYNCGTNRSVQVSFACPTYDVATGVFDRFEEIVERLQQSRCDYLPDPLGYFEFDPSVPSFRFYDRFARSETWKSA